MVQWGGSGVGGPDLLGVPATRTKWWRPLRRIDVGQYQGHWPFPGDLPECGAIKVEELAEATLGVLNFVVYLIGRHIDKTR